MHRMMMLAAALEIAAAPLAFATSETTEQDPGDWRYVAPRPAASNTLGLGGTPQQLNTEIQQWSASQIGGDQGVASFHPDTNTRVFGLFDGHGTAHQLSTEIQQWNGSQNGGSSGNM